MSLGQQHNGATANVTISMNPSTGVAVYSFSAPLDMSIALATTTGIDINGGPAGSNDQFLLQTSSGDTINGGGGNDTFVISAKSADLGGDVLHGGAGVDVVELQGSAQTVDLTGGETPSLASTGIEAVVARAGLSGETVDINLGQIAGSSLSDGGAGPGKAFVALIGADGVVNVTAPVTAKLVGVLNAAGAGFTADGAQLDAADTAALAAEVTSIGDVQGALAADAGKAGATAQSKLVGTLNAYVFSSGSNYYTVWSDGSVTLSDPAGDSAMAYQPPPSVASAPSLGTVAQFTKTGTWSSAALSVNAAGASTFVAGAGTEPYAIVVVNDVTGNVIRGAGGGDWFGLGASGGLNTIVGSAGDDVFDLQSSTTLQDFIHAGAGFNIIRAAANGADVDLTANNGSTAAVTHGIEGVVGGPGASVQTVELDPNSLVVTTNVAGAKTAVFSALLGSSADTLTLEGANKWTLLTTFAPGAALPTNAAVLAGGAALDAAYGSKTHTAENALTGYLFEEVGAKGAAIKYVTIYTDATVSNALAAPAATQMAQAMAAFGASAQAPTTSTPPAQPPATSVTLLHG